MVLLSLAETLAEVEPENDIEENTLNESTHLLGRQAVLDSMGLVTMIVNVEQQLQQDHAVSITIADERALSQKNSPFRTVRSLSDYIFLLIQENND
jgi:acyl carrier protein